MRILRAHARVRRGMCSARIFRSTHFSSCGAVDVIEARLNELGGIQILEGLKLDGNLSSNGSDVEDWANRLLAAL